ncbi:hypothetical protein C823_004242 [Eubacterium plexicaudatum ASF492]|uniref:Uncharacterized protein n=1 Tax=Eubacterium plexicaudatum ASF492 TaxID=1235802 RepID=N2A5P2_9FIRM|nr:hypothetical protein C823_004242 [Eubacterium plexicaudatum ASF492]
MLLYGPEHPGFAASRLYSQYRAELAVELHDAYGGKTDVLHMVKVRVEPLCKTAESKRLPHARACSEQTNAPGILEVIRPGEHLRDVPGKETLFFPGHLFVKRIERLRLTSPLISPETAGGFSVIKKRGSALCVQLKEAQQKSQTFGAQAGSMFSSVKGYRRTVGGSDKNEEED